MSLQLCSIMDKEDVLLAPGSSMQPRPSTHIANIERRLPPTRSFRYLNLNLLSVSTNVHL